MSNGYNLCPFWSCYCLFPFKNSSITLWRNTKALYLNMIYFSLHIPLEFNSLYQGNSRMINVTSTTIIHLTWQVKTGLKTCITSWCFYIILGKKYIYSCWRCSDTSHILEFFEHKLVTIPVNPVTSHINLESPSCPHMQSSWLNFLSLQDTVMASTHKHSSNISKSSCRFPQVTRCWVTRKQKHWLSNMLQQAIGGHYIFHLWQRWWPLTYGQPHAGISLSGFKNSLHYRFHF